MCGPAPSVVPPHTQRGGAEDALLRESHRREANGQERGWFQWRKENAFAKARAIPPITSAPSSIGERRPRGPQRHSMALASEMSAYFMEKQRIRQFMTQAGRTAPSRA